MSTLSELLPSGGGGSTVDFVASGTLPNGKPVILKSDGTVEVVAQAGTAQSIPAGSEYVFNSGSTDYISMAFDPNSANKFVVAYQDSSNSNYGTAIVGTVSGTSISFGSEYVFNNWTPPSLTQWCTLSFDPNTSGKFVITYQDQYNTSNTVVGTVSGTTLSFGAEYAYGGTNGNGSNWVSFDPNTANKFVITYRGSSGYGTAIVGTVSGTTISYGSPYIFTSSNTVLPSTAFDPNTAGKFVVAYTDYGNSNYSTAIVGTVSGTTLSFGTSVPLESAVGYSQSCAFDPTTTGRFVVAYSDNASVSKAIIGTLSGTSVSFGTSAVFESAVTYNISCAFDPNTSGKLVITYRDAGNSSYGTAIVGSVSGNSISYESAAVFNSATTTYKSASFDPNTAGKFLVAYRDSGNSNYGTVIIGQISTTTTNLTSTNFVGTSTAAYTNGQTATIAVQGGLSTNQTGLTIGSTYFVQPTGTLATTAGTPSVNAGKALSATTLLLKDL